MNQVTHSYSVSGRIATGVGRDKVWSIGLAFLVVSLLCQIANAAEVKVGSKSFTESVILADALMLLGKSKGVDVEHRRELGGSQVLFGALAEGDIDAYPEYTGTIRESLFGTEQLTMEEIIGRLEKRGILISEPLGFNNSYGLAVTQEFAADRGIGSISDLAKFDDLRFGFSNEFRERPDCWPGLQPAYNLSPKSVKAMQHTLAYQAVKSGNLQVVDVYTTDSHIEELKLKVLDDDRGFFPRYDAVYLYRADLEQRAPGFVEAIKQLEGTLTDQSMLKYNSLVELEKKSEQEAAATFLRADLDVAASASSESLALRIWRTTWQHLVLVALSLTGAIVVSVPLGVFAAKNRGIGQFLVSIVEVIQTIPGLALLVLIVSLLVAINSTGLQLPVIGMLPVVVALFLYSLLPIVRNTMAGIESVPGTLLESAEAMGLPPSARLRKVELPMASPLILAGIKTTAVINVGYAALGGLIGAGGYGEPIMAGLRLLDAGQMLEGAVPAAILALLVKGGFTLLEKRIVPRGLRVSE